MRMFILLLAIVGATSASFIASADNARGLSIKESVSQSEQTGAASRCAKKIVLPGTNETACLLQKRRGRAA